MGTRLLPLLALAAVLVVSPTASADASTGVWRTNTVASLGFSINTPSSWVDVTDSTAKGLDDLVRPFDSSLASLVRGARSESFLYPLFCIAKSGSAYLDIVEVARGAKSLRALANFDAAYAKTRPTLRGNVTVAALALPSGPAYMVSYEALPAIGESPEAETAFYVARGAKSYTVTFTTSPSLEARYQPIFAQIARSIRLGKVS
jgi:hypothetical protein